MTTKTDIKTWQDRMMGDAYVSSIVGDALTLQAITGSAGREAARDAEIAELRAALEAKEAALKGHRAHVAHLTHERDLALRANRSAPAPQAVDLSDFEIAVAVRDECIRIAKDAPNLPTFCNIIESRDIRALLAAGGKGGA